MQHAPLAAYFTRAFFNTVSVTFAKPPRLRSATGLRCQHRAFTTRLTDAAKKRKCKEEDVTAGAKGYLSSSSYPKLLPSAKSDLWTTIVNEEENSAQVASPAMSDTASRVRDEPDPSFEAATPTVERSRIDSHRELARAQSVLDRIRWRKEGIANQQKFIVGVFSTESDKTRAAATRVGLQRTMSEQWAALPRTDISSAASLAESSETVSSSHETVSTGMDSPVHGSQGAASAMPRQPNHPKPASKNSTHGSSSTSSPRKPAEFLPIKIPTGKGAPAGQRRMAHRRARMDDVANPSLEEGLNKISSDLQADISQLLADHRQARKYEEAVSSRLEPRPEESDPTDNEDLLLATRENMTTLENSSPLQEFSQSPGTSARERIPPIQSLPTGFSGGFEQVGWNVVDETESPWAAIGGVQASEPTKKRRFKAWADVSLEDEAAAPEDDASMDEIEVFQVKDFAPPSESQELDEETLASMVTDLISKRKPGVVPFVSHTPTKTGAITKDDTHPLQDVHPDYVQGPIAQLAHGIDRVLFNPGVHWIRDPHSGVFNFTPYLQTVPDVREFDFNRLYPYVRSSEDDTMRKLAIREGKRYIGSSSSMTGALSHIYRLISGEKPVNLSSLTMAFANEPDNFSAGQVIPVTVRITQKDGIYTLDPDSSDPEDNERHILLWLGTMLEKFLTKTPEQFSQLTRSAPPLAQPPRKETYRYSKSSKFVMRGQLDCVDSRLPGTGVFDIKTRASVLVRLDRFNMDSFAGYEIRTQHGLFESFEREEYDMIRSAFLKYIFQARIGKMDGCIVAYHNTHKLMGFQYFPVEAMEERVYGASGIGERVFLQSLMLLEAILDVAVSIFPDLPISVMFDKVEKTSKMSVFVRPTQGFDPRSVPLALLVVDCQAWLGPIVTNRAKAIVRNRDDLKLEYTIKRYNGTQKAIADLYSGALDRQDLGFPLAPGQSKDDMVTMYRDYNALGKTLTQEQKERVSDMTFYPASSKVKEIRALATKGMHRLQQLDETSLEKPHVVWQPLMYVGSGEADGGADQQITSPT